MIKQMGGAMAASGTSLDLADVLVRKPLTWVVGPQPKNESRRRWSPRGKGTCRSGLNPGELTRRGVQCVGVCVPYRPVTATAV